MAQSPTLRTVAWVELALAVLIVAFFAIGFGIKEVDDIWALGLSTIIFGAPPLAAILLSRVETKTRTITAILLVGLWPFVLAWGLISA